MIGPGTSARTRFPLGHGGRNINWAAAGAGSGPAGRHEAGDDEFGRPKSATVLVVDDDDAVRHYVAYVLLNAGYAVVEAGGGHEAVQAVFDSPGGPDLLLTDIAMPDLDGEQLATIVLDARPDCAVVYMSGDPGNLSRVGYTREPAPLLLAKPFSRDELLETVARSLQSRKGGAG